MSDSNWRINELSYLLRKRFNIPIKEGFGIAGPSIGSSLPNITGVSRAYVPKGGETVSSSQAPTSSTDESPPSVKFSSTDYQKTTPENASKIYEKNKQSLTWDDSLSIDKSFSSDNQEFNSKIDSFMASIAKKESGKLGDRAVGVPLYNKTGNFKGVALGKYQIMSYNWPKWAKEAGLPKEAWDPNVGMSPRNQEYVARHKFNEYYQKFDGDWESVAIAWYSGPNNVQKKKKDTKTQKHHGFEFPSISDYGKDIMRGMKK